MKFIHDALYSITIIFFVVFMPPIGILLEYNLHVNYYIVNTGLIISIIGIITFGVLYLKKKEKEN